MIVFLGAIGLDLIGVDVVNFGSGWAMVGPFCLFVFAFEDEVAIVVDGGVDEEGSNFPFILFDSFVRKLRPFQHVLFFY